MTSRKTAREVFTDIYVNKSWPGGFPETASGAGSLLESTEQLRAGLADLFVSGRLPENPVILDAPCGDFNWFKEIRGYGKYIGIDIVEALVAENTRKYASDNVMFACRDISRDPLPAADLALCRDCLLHLPYDMAFAVVRNLVRSGAPWLLLSSHVNDTNTEIAIGGCREVNLLRPPFNFPKAALQITDDLGPHKKNMYLWTAAQIAQVLP